MSIQSKLFIQSNIKDVVNDIQRQLSAIKGDVKVGITKATYTNLAKTNEVIVKIGNNLSFLTKRGNEVAASFKAMNDAIKDVGKNLSGVEKSAKASSAGLGSVASTTQKAGSLLEEFGGQAALAAKRYSAFTLAVGLGFAAFRGAKAALEESIRFQDKLVKIGQVSTKSLSQLKPLTNTIGNLSTSLGVSSEKLTDASLVLTQAGYTASQVEKALKGLAKTELAPTFESIEQTTEGLIAIFQQFQIEIEDTEKVLGSINKVSAQYAVESGDIVTAIRLAGSAFAALNKDAQGVDLKEPTKALNEFIATFTSIRATTRESANTIATGLKTIASRLQRRGTIEFFKGLGADLTDAQGKFVGFTEAIKKINVAIKGIDARDPRFAALVEELGGIRQINKTIPLLRQAELAQEAYNVAEQAQLSLDEDVIRSKESVARQLEIVRESYLRLFREIGDTSTFKALLALFISAASAAEKLASSLKPIIPLIAALSIGKAAAGIQPFFKGFANKIGQKADGGFIPGTGNRDSELIMAMPGEFIVKQSAAKKLGAGFLNGLNKYANGGFVGIPHFAGGGTVPDTKGVLQAFYKTLNDINKYLPGFAESVKVATKALDNNSRGRFRAQGSNQQITLDPVKATVKTAVHELAHSLDYTLGRALGGKGFASDIKGSGIRQLLQTPELQEFRKEYVDKVRKLGGTRSQIKRVTAPHEIFARYFESRNAEQRQDLIKGVSGFIQHAGYNPPGVQGPPSELAPTPQSTALIRQNRTSKYVGTSGGFLSADKFERDARRSGVQRLGQSYSFSRSSSYIDSILNPPNPPNKPPINGYGGGNVIGGKGFSGASGPNGSKFSNFISGNKIGAGLIGATVLSDIFGSVSHATNAEDRQRGAIGDVLGGTAGAGATAAFLGANPYGIAAAAVIGFTTALKKAQDEIKNADIAEAIALKGEQVKTNPLGVDVGKQIAQKREGTFLGNQLDTFKSIYNGRTVQEERDLTGTRAVKSLAVDLLPIQTKQIEARAKKFGNKEKFITSEEGQKLFKEFTEVQAKPGLGGYGLATKQFEAILDGALGTGKVLRTLETSIHDTVSGYKRLSEVLASAQAATKGFDEAITLAEATAKGQAGTLQFASKGDLIRNPQKETLKQFDTSVQNLLDKIGKGGEGYDAKTVGFISASIPDIVKKINSSGDNPEDTISKYFAGLNRGSSGFAQKAITAAVNKTEGFQDKTTGEKEAVLKEALKGYTDALGELEDGLRKNGNELIQTFARTSEALNNIGDKRFQASSIRTAGINKGIEFSGRNELGYNNVGAFNARQASLAARGGIAGAGLHDVQAIKEQILAVNAERERRATTGIGNEAQAIALNDKATALNAALNNLTHSVDLNTEIERQLGVIQKSQGERLSAAEKIFTGNPEERMQAQRGVDLLNATRANPALAQNLGSADRKLLFQTTRDFENSIPEGGENLRKKILGLQSPDLVYGLDAQKNRLQNKVRQNFATSADALNAQADIEESGVNVANRTAKQKFSAVNSSILGDFNETFKTATKDLTSALSSIPKEIELKGNIALNITMNGAETLAKIEPNLRELVDTRIQAGLNALTKNLRDKSAGPGIPVKDVNVRNS